MLGKGQEIIGKAEEKVGEMLGNEKLEKRGQIDQAAGEAKQEVVKEKRAAVHDINHAARDAKSKL